MRLGLDFGGTKIEGVVLDGGRGRARPGPRADAPPRLRRLPPRDPRPDAAARGRGRAAGSSGSASACPARSTATAGVVARRQLDLAARPRPAGRPGGGAGPAGQDRQRRQLLRAVRGGRRRRRRRAGGLRGDPRLGRRRRHRRARPARRGRERHRRRMGPHPAARPRRTTNGRGRCAPAACRAIPRPGCRGAASPPTTPGGSGCRSRTRRRRRTWWRWPQPGDAAGRGDPAALRGPARPVAGGRSSTCSTRT